MADSANKRLSKLIRRLIYTPQSKKILDQIEDQLGLINTNTTSSTHYEVDNTFSSSLSFENTNKLMQLSSRHAQSGTISYTKSNSEPGTIRHYVQGDGSALNFTSDFIINQNGDITASGQILSLDVTYEILFVSDGEKIATSVVATPAAAIDTTAPTLTSLTISSDNTYGDLVTSEGVYGDSGASLPVETSDLTISTSGGTATFAISSIKQNDTTDEGTSSALTGGESTIRIFFNVTGTVDGNETVTIGVNTNSVYDAAGNVMADTETASDTANVSGGTILLAHRFNDSSIDSTYFNVVNPDATISITEDNTQLTMATDTSGTAVAYFDNSVNTSGKIEKSGALCHRVSFRVNSGNIGFQGFQGIYWPDTAGGINRVIVGRAETTVELSYIISVDGVTVDSGDFAGTDVVNNYTNVRVYYDGSTGVIIDLWNGTSWDNLLTYTLASAFSGNGYSTLSINNPSGNTNTKTIYCPSIDITDYNSYTTARP